MWSRKIKNPLRTNGLSSFAGLKDVLVPIQSDEALLTWLVRGLGGVADHISVPVIPIRRHTKCDNYSDREAEHFGNELHPAIVVIP